MKAFISYSHKDEELREELEEHLSLLKRQGKIDAWTDRRIKPGDEWVDEIGQAMEEADLVLLLISSSFIASNFCYEKEMKRAMERHAQEQAHVVPIIVRSCDWHGAPFGKLQGLPKDGKPITTWDDRDTAWLDVVKGLRRVLANASSRHTNTAANPTVPPPAPTASPDSTAPPGDPTGAGMAVSIGRDGSGSVVTAGAGNQIIQVQSGGVLNISSPSAATDEDSLPAEPDLLSIWLNRVKDDHATLLGDFQTQAGFDLLDPLYVQLELAAELLPPMRGKSVGEEQYASPKSLRRFLKLDPTEHQWVTRRWVVKGDPGAGKTTLLRHLASKLAEEALVSDDGMVPVFESLPRLARSRKWLLEKIDERMRLLGDGDGFGAMLDELGKTGRLLLLFDGLDEVPRSLLSDIESFLRAAADKWPESQLVISSRPIGFRSPDSSFRELRIRPFTHDRKLEFLARWFGRFKNEPDFGRAERCMPRLTSTPSLRDLSSNPLYLTLMALLFENEKEPDALRTKLYDQIFDLLLRSGHRPKEIRREMPRAKLTRAVLRELAESMTQENRDAESREDLEDRICRGPYAKDLRTEPRWAENMLHFLDDLSERTSILGPHDGEEADWRFWHRTFREALTAEALAEMHDSELTTQVTQACGDESNWAEPFALLAGHVTDADALVLELMAQNRRLGLRALATAQGLSEETINEVLLGLDEKALFGVMSLDEIWDARRRVFERLPELVGDPERTLLLIDRLRRRKSGSRGELFLLGQTAQQVADLEIDALPRVESLRRTFYDHLPAPPPDLFQTIDTICDGVVPLWKEVPNPLDRGVSILGRKICPTRILNKALRRRNQIAGGFFISSVCITNQQYAAFDASHADLSKPNHPVVKVNWYDAMAFCSWLAQIFPGARLPSTEEWEYACRGGTTTQYWSGNTEKDLARVGWYNQNSNQHLHAVGEKPPNAFGLYDVHGNVWEWTLSRREGGDMKRLGGRVVTTTNDISAFDSDIERACRGGSFIYSANSAKFGHLQLYKPETGHMSLGFRVVFPSALIK